MEYDNPTFEEDINEIKQYYVGDLDFTEINNARKKIAKNSSRMKELIKDLDNRINLDFVQESEIIEDSNKKDCSLSEFLSDDVKIMRCVPIEYLSDEFLNARGEERENLEKQLFKKVVLIAENFKTKERRMIANCKHFCALDNIIKIAHSARYKNIKGKKQELDHYVIMDTNALLFEETLLENSCGIGSYRSKYSTGRTSITNARWTPVKSAKVFDKMEALLKWYNEDSKDLHPIERAAILHTEFIRIHPFYDGNGRTARLLMNYELMKYGYPTIVIKAENKSKYIAALEKGVMTKDVSNLVELIANAVKISEKKYLNTIKKAKTHFRENERIN